MKNNLKRVAAVFSIVAALFFASAAAAQNYNGYSNQGTPATSVPVNGHNTIASDSYGNVFIADADNNRILLLHTNGTISTFAGTGAQGYWGDGGPAISANLNYPGSVAIDAQGIVYIADTRNNRIRMVDLQGIITTIAGNGAQGFSGDGGPAIYATLNAPTSVTVDANRNIYISDNYNNRVRMINSSSGVIYTIAGNGATYYQPNNGAMAPVAQPVYTPSYAAAPVSVTYQSYYDELAPYGQWVNTPGYGNVWVPSAGPGFVPYSTAGHWVYTNYGWTWVSDYSWGWCAFHYGRWDYDNYMGWFWVPGNEWAPAWVSWRSGNGYYGWAPLPPAYGNVSETNTYIVPTERYVFVQNQYMCSPDVYNHYVPREQNVTYVTNTITINRTYVDNNTHTTCYAGPPKEEVERYTNTPVKVYTVNSTDKPGQTEDRTNGALMIYRPKVENPPASQGAKAPEPAHVYAKEEIKPVAERPVITQPKQEEEKHETVIAPEHHNDVTPDNTPGNTRPHSDVTPNHATENAQPGKDLNTNQNAPQTMNHTVSQNDKPIKQGQPVAPVKDKQIGKDAQGHIIYQDKKGSKYYMNEKGAKVIVPQTKQNPQSIKAN